MPLLGLGTWRAAPGIIGETITRAVRLGYTHIDCADRYGNQREIGDALRALQASRGLNRPLFITSKLWNNDHAPERVRPAVLRMLRELGVQRLDLLLMHWPLAVKRTCGGSSAQDGSSEGPTTTGGSSAWDGGCDGEPEDIPLVVTWKAMEALVDEGLVGALGVSNFGPARLAAFMDDPQVRLAPAVNQVELHPYLPQPELLAECEKRHVALVAFCPIGSPGNAALRAAPHRSSASDSAASGSGSGSGAGSREQGKDKPLLPMLIDHPSVLRVAQRTNKTPSQVLLRWNLDRGVAVIPKSTSPDHLAENAAVFGWTLGDRDRALLDEIAREAGGVVRYVPAKTEHFLDPARDEASFWD